MNKRRKENKNLFIQQIFIKYPLYVYSFLSILHTLKDKTVKRSMLCYEF